MTANLSQEVIDLLNDPETTKVLATVDTAGEPHAVVKQSLHLGEDGNIHYLERIESSTTNRNLVRSIWFDGSVAISLTGRNGRTVQIKGKPIKIHVSGPLFLDHYNRLRATLGDSDLAGVWVIEPERVIDQALETRRAIEAEKHPHFIHLDRLARH
ncbi:hypothetical protein [Telmatospirillum siberiense]|uniref:Pyridoxamine 5'-phosphate oxidase putative domain-containing protein n=1 Tax=Telmatospirillum siberiense TaxID=382514 RepID=A0A2N3PXN4_9PROT|nr:hypothetical protein [Telmatospirillum siberiense]PKU25173.1 hypothetical protein CWS72_08245 [Telmatospirillum siberiense]